MNAFRALVACSLVVLTTVVAASAQTWTGIGPAGGEFGHILVAPSQPTTLYASPGNDAGGLFKSTNGGDSWQSITGSMTAASCDIHVNDLAIHPTQPDTIYAATQALGVCKSTDGGTTWTQSIAGLPNDANQYQRPVLSIAINPQTPTVLFAGTQAGIYLSVNGGSTWTLSGAPNQPIVSVAFAPSAANTAYAYANGTVYKTTDGGSIWAPTANLSPSTTSDGVLTVSPASPNTVLLVVEDNVYRTTNGNSWAVSISGATGAFFYGNVSIDPTNTNTMFLTAVGSCGLCKSTDGGATWAAVAATGLPSGFGTTNVVMSTSIDPTAPSRMFAGTPFGAYRSTNNGVTWSAISTGLNGQAIGAMGVGGDSPASVFIGSASGTTDGSDLLKLSGGSLPFSNLGNVVSSGRLTDVLVDPTSANIIYAVGGKSSGQNCGQVYKSTNGGAAWTAINPSTVPATLCAGPLAMDPSTPATLYLGVFSPTGGAQSAIVYKTTNGGSSWTSVSTGLSFSVQRIAISKRTPAVLYAGSASQVFKTTNGGGSWSSAGSGLPTSSGGNGGGRLAIDPADDNIVYFATFQGVYGTTNGGTSWTAKRGGWPTIKGNFFGANALAIDPNTPTTLYASTATPTPGPVGSFLGTGSIGTGLYKSTDSGATWASATDVLAGVNVSDVLFDGTRILAATNNGVFRFAVAAALPTITVDKTSLAFAAVTTGAAFTSKTSAQAVRITQAGAGAVTWTASSTTPWLVVTPSSGSGSATLNVSVQFASALAATQTGTVTLTFTGAANTAGPISVTLTTVTTTAAAAPFGSFDTPVDGITGVTGSIGVTGWVLDDLGVTRVKVMRDPVAGETPGALIFIGDAVLVDGARSDIAGLYPSFPRASRAGWGYLMLTNFLPGLGNGTYKLTAVAEDEDGHSTILGSKTITCANSTATAPFGAIDTPGQGEVVTSPSLNNFGWVLSPGSRKAAPPDGGTVSVVIDGVLGVSPTGWTSRSDLTALFPAASFSGIANALGVATLDMTALANGVHTIAWVVTDNQSPAGAAGVGSRYFTVSNGSLTLDASMRTGASRGSIVIPSNGFNGAPSAALRGAAIDNEPIAGRRGFDPDTPLQTYTAVDGRAIVQAEELDRVELHLGAVTQGATYAGYLRVGDRLAPLPAGSALNADSGEFTWQPGVAFVGAYDLVFARLSGGAPVARRDVRVVLNPKGSNRIGTQTVIDFADGQVVAGWAADVDSQLDSGVDTVHVWAYPLKGGAYGDPVFVGAADYGGARPDVAAIYGERFRNSGYGLRVEGLAPGTYDLAVFAYSTVKGGFVAAKVVRVTVR